MRLRPRRREPFDILPVDFGHVVAETGIPYPNPRPYADCSVVTVIWNEEARIGKLLLHLQPYFRHIVVCVQASSDRSLEVARKMCREGDLVIEDEHRGFAEGSAPLVAPVVQTEWAFVVSADERPSVDLLESVQTIIGYAEPHGYQAVWVPFLSTIDGVPFEEQRGHLRILRRGVEWSRTLHSRPRPARSMWWSHGHIDHDRSLDEMVRDYLRYLDLGRDTPLLVRHNTRMIHDACAAVATRYGWDYVAGHEWWPRVREVAFQAP